MARMQDKNKRWQAVSGSSILFYALCGLLLLIWPNFALDIANYAISVVLIAVGAAMIVSYVRSTPYDGATSFNLSIGIALAIAGIVLFVNDGILKSLLPMVWGISLIGAIISIVLGLIAVLNPAFIATTATMYAGIALLVEALMDAASLFAFRRESKDHLNHGEGSVR